VFAIAAEVPRKKGTFLLLVDGVISENSTGTENYQSMASDYV